ncbi:hypothetical protein VB005_10772 [Metarhizium brunneum]
MAEHDDLSEILGPSATRDAVPRPNQTYVILDRSSDAAIAIFEGKIRLERDIGRAGNCYWQSVEKDGWMGFREAELERYLGHDFWWKFTAESTEHGEYGYFVPRRHPDGGYELLAPSLGKLLHVVAGEGGELRATEKGGTTWEFVRVDDGIGEGEGEGEGGHDDAEEEGMDGVEEMGDEEEEEEEKQ